MPRTRGRPSKRGGARLSSSKRKGPGRPRKHVEEEEIITGVIEEYEQQIEEQVMEAEVIQSKKRGRKSIQKEEVEEIDEVIEKEITVHEDSFSSQLATLDEEQSCGLHVTTMQIKALAQLVACKDCGESITLSIRPTTKGMISEFVVSCSVCEAKKVTITPNLVRERKRKREVKGLVLQKTENINYAHVASFLDNGLGYCGLRHYCKYFNARCLNEATFIVYARQVIQDVVNDTEDNLQSNARIVRKTYDASLDEILDITVSYTTTYHQWGSDFCLVAGAVIELQTGLVLDYDVANMYCHVCKINAKRIISMTPTEMTEWFNKHQNTCEIREWCDELDHDADEGVKDIEPKYLECFVAKKIWSRSIEKFGFRYSTLIHESDETIHNELLRAAPYGDTLVMIDNLTNCFSRRKSEHARTSFQNKLKSKCPRERVQTKDRIMYVYAMSIPEYNRFAVGSNIKLRELVRKMEIEETEEVEEGSFTLQVMDGTEIQVNEMTPVEGGEHMEMEGEEVGEIITGDVGDNNTLETVNIEGENIVIETTEEEEEQTSVQMEELEEEEEIEEEPKTKKIKLETTTLVLSKRKGSVKERKIETSTIESSEETEDNITEESAETTTVPSAPSTITVVSTEKKPSCDKNTIILTKTVVASTSSNNKTSTTTTKQSKVIVSTTESGSGGISKERATQSSSSDAVITKKSTIDAVTKKSTNDAVTKKSTNDSVTKKITNEPVVKKSTNDAAIKKSNNGHK